MDDSNDRNLFVPSSSQGRDVGVNELDDDSGARDWLYS